ncbi:hydroxymyristoyl-ACP dehydratase [Arenibacter sp. BSSL-BM3]|uniref:Hydroxymyristoyl-ACP dehydratase n=1 Tax=Arenibacter arenosicollis TaxID=2762274 RepID=A0ABR7QNR8_9FLAO|nr:hydroxymyristoyl-ACP dehydratase [Arenibacter arenosicollis]MBC8768835.1 hydroxymyristoyl-ACP dehydratase [Arenibacter arenosicollis]
MLYINNIIKKLPYTDPFLFVDGLQSVTENTIEGSYTFKKDEFFYMGHFKEHAVTPGVILTECCAQIGLVCLGIYLLDGQEETTGNFQVALSSSEMQFLLPVYPLEKVTVKSNKVYFRFNKLKCEVKMYNQQAQLVCKGVLSGMLKNSDI